MIQVFNNPLQKDWGALLARPGFDASTLLPRVQAIINDVRENGDDALLKYTKEFDQVQLQSIALSEVIKKNAEQALSNSLKTAIHLAKENIEKFHLPQLQKMERIEELKPML
jgi:histidinol dehydrogenase